MSLNDFCKETSDRYYNWLVKRYKNRINIANDKEYAHHGFLNYCNSMLILKFDLPDREIITKELDNQYKLGNDFSIGIKLIRKYLKNLTTKASFKFNEEMDIDENTNFEEVIIADYSSYFIKLNNITDTEIVRIYAEYRAYLRFNDFLKSETPNLSIEDIPEIENKEPSKENTLARQVLAIHYIFKCFQVKNVDKTEIARFIKFLTDKNLGNIYKKLQNPFKVNEKSLKSDLRFIREYFEKLGITNVVKMINNELNI